MIEIFILIILGVNTLLGMYICLLYMAATAKRIEFVADRKINLFLKKNGYKSLKEYANDLKEYTNDLKNIEHGR